MDKPFIAWDGEGITVKGKHVYVMMCNSLGESIVNPTGLHTLDIFTFIGNSKAIQTPSINVVFGGSYDANMLLRSLDMDSIRTLWTTGEVTYQCYRIKYRHRKQLTISKYASTRWKVGKGGKYSPNYEWSIKLWDVYGFFQTSFIKATASYGLTADILINEMKLARGTALWDGRDMAVMQAYCIKECEQLVELMNTLRSHLDTAGISLSRWDGAGAVAGAIMKRHKIKLYSDTPLNLESIAATAYSGGRIEAFRYGNTEQPVYVYDINSAYPSIIRDLPDLVDGAWHRLTEHNFHKLHIGMFGMVKVRWKINIREKINPFFWRASNGCIYYPHAGVGWYHIPEYLAAVMDGRNTDIRLLDAWVWESNTDFKPFSFVDDMYKQRAIWKKENNGAQMVLKLGMNSLYGKLVQQLGGTKDKRPPYHNLLWGGYITSFIRAKLYAAMMLAPNDIIYSATDGIASRVKLDLDIGKNLGQWEETRYEGCTVIQPGVYFLLGKNGKPEVTHYRGFDPGTLTRDIVLEAWKNNEETLEASSTRFIGMGSALASRDYENKWCQWPTVQRKLTMYPQGKRYPSVRYGTSMPSMELCSTFPDTPWGAMSGVESHAYKLQWAEDAGIDGIPSPTVADECEYGRL